MRAAVSRSTIIVEIRRRPGLVFVCGLIEPHGRRVKSYANVY